MNDVDDIIKIHCNGCKQETNHKKEWEKNHHWSANFEYIEGNTKSQIFSCMGCNNITFRIVNTCSEDVTWVSDKECEYDETISYYPPRNKEMIDELEDIHELPKNVSKIYLETIKAYNSNQKILCAIGVRTILEAVCLEEGIKNGTLKDKISDLKTNGIITSNLYDGLDENRLIGNESAHEVQKVSDLELSISIALINNLLESHYISPEKIKLLKTLRNNRKNKNKVINKSKS